MTNGMQPYISHNPGDLVTAEDWNGVQVEIKKDIAAQVQTGVGGIKSVEHAGDTDKLGGKTADQLTQDILEKAKQEIPKRTGYRLLFKRLKFDEVKKDGEEKVIKHHLETCPLVDVYQLDYFEVVCADGEDKRDAWVNFYLYHTSEKKLRLTGPPAKTIEIEPIDSHAFKIPFKEMLDRYHVEYTETTGLGDLVTDFWKALFANPNDEFEVEQFCHSPWFEKCCGDRRTVGELKKRGDWDDIWFKMMPRKTINYNPATATDPTAAPTQIQVVHFDFNTIGIKLLSDPILPQNQLGVGVNKHELKVMLLLKV